MWAPHHLEQQPRRRQSGGIATLEARHAGDTPPEGFAWRKTPTATSTERAAGAGGPGWGAGGWRKPRNCTHHQVPRETNLAQHEPHGPTSGTKLSQHTPSHRMCGTKLSLHARPRRISGTKLSLLTRNGSIWRFFDMQGEFCTVLTIKKPSRENFVPNARQRWSSPTQQHTSPTGVEGTGGSGGHGRASRRGLAAAPRE